MSGFNAGDGVCMCVWGGGGGGGGGLLCPPTRILKQCDIIIYSSTRIMEDLCKPLVISEPKNHYNVTDLTSVILSAVICFF